MFFWIVFKVLLIVFSSLTAVLSLIFMLSGELFSKIEEALGMEVGAVVFATALEGKINFVNNWVYRNKNFFGPLFAVLAAYNTRNAFFLF